MLAKTMNKKTNHNNSLNNHYNMSYNSCFSAAWININFKTKQCSSSTMVKNHSENYLQQSWKFDQFILEQAENSYRLEIGNHEAEQSGSADCALATLGIAFGQQTKAERRLQQSPAKTNQLQQSFAPDKLFCRVIPTFFFQNQPD
eukprot:TRINITY_DN3806_c0_g1_i4.p4 TRINITY_DN3806_c0_g1~~TRINITY_DN3806_c0_g1_i4.p4  ORF type:complete len:145 (-),score=10.23 TRINITY_DN3806_c0_g1_i4:521-955(-)